MVERGTGGTIVSDFGCGFGEDAAQWLWLG